MKGRILDINILDENTESESIVFDVEIDKKLTELDVNGKSFSLIGNSKAGDSIIRFKVNKFKNADEDDEGHSDATIPFQIVYAVSIHKAQGLEYNSVKLIITEEVEEQITHNIFYTAITRAKSKLKIYWTPEVERSIISNIRPDDNSRNISIMKAMLQK